ncbi:uncharacterized protein LOC113360203 [Papaver somniferum]|uniref:uncharacterized protein LOC113360203 n=1 Tax=Papaver somniferum TaxID=3469 RepID=UPI000E6FBBAB|nr:uncharacterized protein LOC113360203 [Papaver somniferum]
MKELVVELDLGKNDGLKNKVPGRLTSRFCTETIVESLVSLHSGTYVRGGQEKSDLENADYDHQSSPNEVVIQKRMDFPFEKYMFLAVIQIIGSCNGLFFVKIGFLDVVTGLWNPATREYKIIPRSEAPNEIEFGIVRNYGFGYDRVRDEYKLVTIVTSRYSYDDIMVSRVEVYSLSSNSWRRIDYIPYKIRDELTKSVCIHDALHCLANPCPIRSSNKFSQVLLCFNMAKEVFYELPLLQIFDDDKKFKDNVSIFWKIVYACLVAIIVFVLRRIQSLKNGEILLEIQLENWFRNAAVIFYDPKHERARIVEIDLGNYDVWRNCGGLSIGRLTSRFCTETCVESLVSLHSDTYAGGGQEKSDFSYASRR